MRTSLKLIILAVLLAGAWLAYALYTPLAPPGEQLILLRSGLSVRQIAAELQAAGVIRDASAFLALHAVKGRPSLKAGEYRFDRPADAFEVLGRVARGDVVVRTVIVPEGYNMFEIADTVAAAGLCTREQFLEAARTEVALIADLDPSATTLEGYLFPDTYQFTRAQGPREIAAAMVRRFRQEATALALTSDVRRVVVLASIVEKETAVPEERPLVAGVFQNRLQRNMVLAADPTVVYGALLAGRYRGAIHQSDLAFDTPYNTYRRVGLPPGPIANPGRDSLRAAMQPASTTYVYFVSDARGRHRFASTAAEHSRNVAAYRRELGRR
ncbi:MAG TPA: endolytic transglycosylase MltG [Terriglobales bacterium]|nr:endolytic transglycosylase MltG [Terriglobales bacterium]